VYRRLVCLLLSLFVVAAVVARVAAAHPHLRHATGTLAVEVRDDRNGPLPARLTFRPVGDTPALSFTTIDIAREEAGAIAAFDRAFVQRGDADIRVPVGPTMCGSATIDVHHPRLLHGSMGYFVLADFDLATGKTRTSGFSLDFDAIEVLNGYQDSDRRTMDKVIGDWIGLLDLDRRRRRRQGHAGRAVRALAVRGRAPARDRPADRDRQPHRHHDRHGPAARAVRQRRSPRV
jgi:hypothetical protein